jgi:hypothetical protein
LTGKALRRDATTRELLNALTVDNDAVKQVTSPLRDGLCVPAQEVGHAVDNGVQGRLLLLAVSAHRVVRRLDGVLGDVHFSFVLPSCMRRVSPRLLHLLPTSHRVRGSCETGDDASADEDDRD